MSPEVAEAPQTQTQTKTARSSNLVSKSTINRMFRDYNAVNTLTQKGYLKELASPGNRTFFEILNPLPSLQDYDKIVNRPMTEINESGQPKRRRRRRQPGQGANGAANGSTPTNGTAPQITEQQHQIDPAVVAQQAAETARLAAEAAQKAAQKAAAAAGAPAVK